MRFQTVALFFLLIASFAGAQSYYGDVTVSVDETGMSHVSGRTNHPVLQIEATPAFTSKKANAWLFNLTLPAEDVFSDYVYEVVLPQGASVNYVKSTGLFRIGSNEGRISVSGVGKTAPLGVVIQYQMPSSEGGYPSYMIAGFVLIIALSGYLALTMLRKRHNAGKAKTEVSYNTDILNKRQMDIMEIITNSKEPVNQALICEKLGLPKSSVSRNINGLVRMGLVSKTRSGMSTLITPRKND